MYTIDPIGFFHTATVFPCEVPRQAVLGNQNKGIIELKKGCQFEQALEGLEGFDRIWVVFRFHRHNHWKPKVLPPRGGIKQGVFATRSPHRPNFIGFSSVQLIGIEGLKLYVLNHDLIDGTPILDVKPYIQYADAFSCKRQGWLDKLPDDFSCESIEWSELAQIQINYLISEWNYNLREAIERRLMLSPYPYPNNRIKLLDNGMYQLAYRTWRIYYQLQEKVVKILYLQSGYDHETLYKNKPSKWDDVFIHQAFVKHFV